MQAQTTLNTTAAPALVTEFEALWTGINRTTFNVTYLPEWRNFTNATVNPGVGELLLHNIGAMQCAVRCHLPFRIVLRVLVRAVPECLSVLLLLFAARITMGALAQQTVKESAFATNNRTITVHILFTWLYCSLVFGTPILRSPTAEATDQFPLAVSPHPCQQKC